MADTWCSVCAGSHERGFDCVTPDKTTSAIDLVERLDLPEAFEAWWQPCRHKNREPITDYNRKKQLAFDAFQAGVHAARAEAADTLTRLQAALENPTPEMIDAGRAALREHTDEEIDVAEIYRAMTQALGGE